MTSEQIKDIMIRYSFCPHWSDPGKYVWRRFGVLVVIDINGVGSTEAEVVERIISELQNRIYEAHAFERNTAF